MEENMETNINAAEQMIAIGKKIILFFLDSKIFFLYKIQENFTLEKPNMMMQEIAIIIFQKNCLHIFKQLKLGIHRQNLNMILKK